MKNTKSISKINYAIIAIAFLSLCFMIVKSEDQGFWYDEFAQICYSGSGKSLLDSALILDPTPPLFNIIANIWYRIMPYGERYLLLLPQIATCGGIIITGLLGKKVAGNAAGVITAALLGSSQMVIEQCGFEFRSYGLYLLLASSALYLHSEFTDDKPSAGKIAILSAVLTAFVYSHLFAVLMTVAMGIYDIINVILRKRSALCIIPYCIAALLFVPWLLYFFIENGAEVVSAGVNWMVKPSLWEVIKLFAYLNSNNLPTCILFAIGVCSTVYSVKTKKALDEKSFLIAVMIVMIVIEYIFGTIRWEYASLWTKRYFTGLFPCAAILSAIGACEIYRTICKFIKPVWSRIISISILLFIIPVTLFNTAVNNTPLKLYYHREIASIICQSKDMMNSEVLVVSSLEDYWPGWYEYYVTRKYSGIHFDVISSSKIENINLNKYDVVYFDHGFLAYPEYLERAKEILDRKYNGSEKWETYDLTRYY